MFKRYFLAGLLVWLPVLAAFTIVRWIIQVMDISLSLLPSKFQPALWLGFNVPGAGLVLSLLIIIFTGMFATNFLGKRLVSGWEYLLAHIPVVSSIYKSVKQVLQTLFSSSGNSFRQVLLVEYPRVGMWSLAFQTNSNEIDANLNGTEKMLTVFIPTTPNPTSGFLLIVNEQQARRVEISVEDALKFIISLGVVAPESMNLLSLIKKY
jgi:uncharacterized membrane protein